MYIDNQLLSIALLDEVLFRIDNLLDYRAGLKEGKILSLSLKAVDENKPLGYKEVRKALETGPFNRLLRERKLILEVADEEKWEHSETTMVKRVLEILD